MAFKETQSAIVIDTLIVDLVYEAIDRRQTQKEPTKSGPCQRLYDILGILPCGRNDEEIEIETASANKECNDAKCPSSPICSEPAVVNQKSLKKAPRQKWHSWLVPALANDSSGDELDIYKRNKQCSDIACQTEQPRFRKRVSQNATCDDPAPCELNRHTIFIDAVPAATPSLQNRPPLADRFCYMLTDFASALYCSLAIMCCCTPNMFR